MMSATIDDDEDGRTAPCSTTMVTYRGASGGTSLRESDQQQQLRN